MEIKILKIPFDKKIKAHSDGDVLLHSICDALLGAAALGDIGTHFPDNDDKYKNISSIKLLKETVLLLKKNDFSIKNIDSTIALQEPKLKDFIPEIRKNIAKACQTKISDISVKVTTTEKLGYVGEVKGAESYSIVMIN